MHKTIGQNGAQILRYTEYLLSAPLMIIAIALSFDILKIYTLIGLAALTSLCMQFGLIADVMRVSARDLIQKNVQSWQSELVAWMIYSHLIGWVAV